MHGKVQHVAHKCACKIQGLLNHKPHQIFVRRRRVVSGVKKHIHVVIHASTVECQWTECRWVCISLFVICTKN